MAKQKGIHRLSGKVDGMSYYSSKNGGSLARSINDGMSERVKTAKEYINTRKNNAEFGMCGDFAGAIIKPISQRWRFILDSIATGKMVKVMKDAVKLNTLNPWGQRVLGATDYPAFIEAFNSFSKNEMIDEIANVLAQPIDWASERNTVTVQATPNLSIARQEELNAEGINYFYTKVYALQVKKPVFNTAANAYTKAISSLVELTSMSYDAELNSESDVDLFAQDEAVANFADVVDNGEFGGLLVVFLPARKVGSSISVLQEKCSAMLAPVVEAGE